MLSQVEVSELTAKLHSVQFEVRYNSATLILHWVHCILTVPWFYESLDSEYNFKDIKTTIRNLPV